MSLFAEKINFDRFVRGLLLIIVITAIVMAIHALSSVLLPFVLAWVLAYILNPIVNFLQYRLHLRWRWLSIVATLLLIVALIVLLFWLVIPPALHECVQLKNSIVTYLSKSATNTSVPQLIEEFVKTNLQNEEVKQFLQTSDVRDFIYTHLVKLGNFLWHTADALFTLFSWCITLLYLIFLLFDFDKMSKSWINYIPPRFRKVATNLSTDVEKGMNAYFRGQTLVAMCVGVLFAFGFSIIGLPIAIGFGLFVGLLNLVPYLQVVSLPIAALLALLHVVESGENFWGYLFMVTLVYVVVQLIQDLLIVPRIMGRIMGLSPAIILLSLSVWGYTLGFIGLIIALPLTTLIVSYYQRYIIRE